MGLDRDRAEGTSAVAAVLVAAAPAPGVASLADAFVRLKAVADVPDDIQHGVEWILRTAVATADSATRASLEALGITQASSAPSTGDTEKRRRKKRAGAKRKQLMSKFSKMQSTFKAMLPDDDDDGDGDDASTSSTAPEGVEGSGGAGSDAHGATAAVKVNVSCIQCQEEGDARKEDFVVLGCFAHGSVLAPQRHPPHDITGPDDEEGDDEKEGSGGSGGDDGARGHAGRGGVQGAGIAGGAMADDSDIEDAFDLDGDVDDEDLEVEIDDDVLAQLTHQEGLHEGDDMDGDDMDDDDDEMDDSEDVEDVEQDDGGEGNAGRGGSDNPALLRLITRLLPQGTAPEMVAQLANQVAQQVNAAGR